MTLWLLTESWCALAVIDITNDLIWELQDQVACVGRKVDALLAHAGIDPEEAGRRPGRPEGGPEAA